MVQEMKTRERKTFLIDKISFDLPPDYIFGPSKFIEDTESLFIPFKGDSVLETRQISKDGLTVDVIVEMISSWMSVEEYTFSRFYNYKVPIMRKFFMFRDEYPAVIVQTTNIDGDDENISEKQRRSKPCYLTISILLSHSLVISFRSRVESSVQWDEVHNIMDTLHVSGLIPEGKLKINTSITPGQNIEMQLPSVFCSTMEEGRAAIPRKYLETLFGRSNLIYEVVSPHFKKGIFPAPVLCGFSLFKVPTDNLQDFIERYQNEHAPAPEKIDQNLKVKNMVCRFFHFKTDGHTFLDCIFRHPEFKRDIFIFSIYVDKFVSNQQMGIYISSILKCVETMEITTPVMANVRTTFFYESKHYGFSMILPSNSVIVENPAPFVTNDCIVNISSQIVLVQKSPKQEIVAPCRTRIMKYTREVPEEEDPDPEKLANLKREQLLRIYPENCVTTGLLNDEWTTRYTSTYYDKFIVGTFIYYNASEIYLFETEVVSVDDLVIDQAVCLHNTITFHS